MSLVPALDELDHKSDHGWSQANRFSNTITVSQPGSDIDHWQHSSDSIEENYQRQPSSLQFQRESSKADRNWQHTDKEEETGEDWQDEAVRPHSDSEITGKDWQDKPVRRHSDNEETGEDWQDEPVHRHRDKEETGEDWQKETVHPHRHQEQTGEDWQNEQLHHHQEWQQTDREENRGNWEEEEESSPDPEDWQQNLRGKNWQQELKPEQVRDWKQAPRRNIPHSWQEDQESLELKKDWPQEERQEPRGVWKQGTKRNIPDNWQEDRKPQKSKGDWQQAGENKREWHHKHLPKSQENLQQRQLPKNWPQKDLLKSGLHQANWQQKQNIPVPKNWQQQHSLESKTNWQQKGRSGGYNWQKGDFPKPELDWQQSSERDFSEVWDEEELPEESEDWPDREVENKREVWQGDRPDQSHHWQSHHIGRVEGEHWQRDNRLPESRPGFHPTSRREVQENWQGKNTTGEEEEEEEEDWQAEDELPEFRPGFHPTSRREVDKNWQGQNTRGEPGQHWQQGSRLPEPRPSWHPTSGKDGNKHYQGKSIRREGEELKELPESRPGFPPLPRREGDKPNQGKSIRKEEEHWQSEQKLPKPRPGFPPTSQREVDKNWQRSNTEREEEEEEEEGDWQPEDKLPESRPGFHPTSRREGDKLNQEKNIRREEGEHWQQGNRLPESRPGFPPASRREVDDIWQGKNTTGGEEEEDWQAEDELPESRPGFHPTPRREGDKLYQEKNIRREEGEHWQQGNRLPESIPGFPPALRREADKNWQGQNTRIEQEEEEEDWEQDNRLPESRPGFQPVSRREGNKHYQGKNTIREEEGHWQQDNRLPKPRPGFPPASRREADKNWQGKNTVKEEEGHLEQDNRLPKPRPGIPPVTRREADKDWQVKNTRREQGEHWQQQQKNKLPLSKPGWHPTPREAEQAKHWQLQQQRQIGNWKQQQSRISNWQQEDSSEEELLEHWHHDSHQEPLDNWGREDSLDSAENWELVNRQKASQHWHQEGSSDSEDNWPYPGTPESSENWQDSKNPLPPKNWPLKESQQNRKNLDLCNIPPQIKKTPFEKRPERPDNWKDIKSTEPANKEWQERQAHPSKPAENWPESRPPKPTENWPKSRPVKRQIEDWPDSESDGPPEDWEEESEESLPPSDLSEPDDWPDIELPEPIQENNKRPIIQEIREEDIVSVPSNIIKSVPGTPQARLVSTPKGQSILVHSEGDQYLVVSPNKQSPQPTTLSQLVTYRPRHNLHNVLTRKDNPKNFQLRTPNQHPRFPFRGPNIRGNSPRARIASKSPGIRLIHSEDGGFTVFPASSPSKSGPATYFLPPGARGRGRGRGCVIPPNRGGSNRSRGQNIRGRGNSPMVRPPRGAFNVQYNPNIQGVRFPNQVRLVNPSPHNPQPQIFRPRGNHTPRILRVAKNPTIGHRSSVPIVTSGPASSSSCVSVDNVTSTSEHNLPIQQQEITSVSSEKDSLVSEDSQSEASSQTSQMIVDHEYAAPEPNTRNSESAASNRQGTDLSDSESSCHTNTETACLLSKGNGRTSPESSQDSNRTSVSSLPGTPVPSKKNTLPVGAGKLEVNTVYLIKSPNFPERKMIWNGEKFQEYDERTFTITSENSEGNMSGGGVGENNRGKQLRGNSTGLHMTQNRSMIIRPGNPSQTTAKVLHKTSTNQNITNDVLPNGRTWKHTTKPSAILTRRPLHSDSDKKVTTIIVDRSPAGNTKRITVLNDSTSSSAPSSSQESVQTQCQDDQEEANEEQEMQQQQIVESKKRKRLQESGYREGECVVHCKYCGYSSSNVMFCDSCHRAFPDDIKIEPLIKKGRTCVSVKENETNVAIDKRTFYGQKLAEQSQPYQSNIVHITSAPPTGSRYRMVRISSARKKPAMPVTVTISSDEEDETSNRPSSAGSSAAAEETDSLSQIVAEIPKGRPSSPKFNAGRVRKMEDEMGNPVLMRKAGRKNIQVIPVNRSVLDNPNCIKVKSIPQAPPPPPQASVHLTTRCIRIGSLRGVPVEPIFISADGVFFYIECEDNSHRISIEPQNVLQCLVCSKVMPVIFIRTTPEFGQDLRSLLKMENDAGPYFDPQHSEMKNQYIMLLLQDFGNVHHSLLNILSQYSNSNEEQKQDFLCELSPEEADQIFRSINFDTSVFPNVPTDSAQNNPAIENQMEVAQSSEASMMAGMTQESKVENRERSPSPKIMFSGPVKKLITFPPPPAKGGISVTNEDLFCLTEGEFLNDVIIDFYLKYLLLDRLNEEDRKRTHIFSSFFFKRLTQRLANRPEDGATPAEKRHSRVKTWTKHVDLFEKDFIVVPINEHSHWFLAIICFPGLLQNETVTFIPKNRLESNVACNAEINMPKQDSPAPSNQNDVPKTESPVPEEKSVVEQSETQEQEQLKEQQQPQQMEQDQDQQQQQQQQQLEQQQEPKQEEQLQQEKQQQPQQEEQPQQDEQQPPQQQQQQEQLQQQEEQKQPPPQQQQQQKQQQDEEMKDSYDKQTEESNSKETGELEPGEVPMDTSNIGVTKIPSARYFSKESRGKLVTKEDLEDPEIANMTVTGYRQPCIMVFDSLSGVSRSRIVNILKEYLQVEWAKKKQTELNLKERLRGGSPKVPQQTNYSDCGVYVLQYVESFFEDPIQDFSFPMKSLQTWFSGERIRRKREEIKELILTISEIQHKS